MDEESHKKKKQKNVKSLTISITQGIGNTNYNLTLECSFTIAMKSEELIITTHRLKNNHCFKFFNI